MLLVWIWALGIAVLTWGALIFLLDQKKAAVLRRATPKLAFVAIVLFAIIPIPRLYLFNKKGTVRDSATGMPIGDAVVAFGLERVCGGLGGATGRSTKVSRTKSDANGTFQLRGALFSFDWISIALVLSGCDSEAQEYVCKEGYAPKTTTFDWYENRYRPKSPVETHMTLHASTEPFKYPASSRFNLLRDMTSDCKVEVDWGIKPVKKT
jgi:hypothetical protein